MSFPPPVSEVWGKTFGPIGSVAGLKFYHKIGLYLIRNLSAIPSVHMNFLKCRPKERCLSAEWAGKPGIMLSCIADCFGKNEAVAVNHYIAPDSHSCLFNEMFDMAVLSPLAEKFIDRLLE